MAAEPVSVAAHSAAPDRSLDRKALEMKRTTSAIRMVAVCSVF